MRKSDKKLEKQLVAALTEACEEALKAYDGFLWITHIVNYQSFPDSLSIICVFDCKANLLKTTASDKVKAFKAEIESRLQSHGLGIKDIQKRILFDTEEACDRQHGGNWDRRFEGLHQARHA